MNYLSGSIRLISYFVAFLGGISAASHQQDMVSLMIALVTACSVICYDIDHRTEEVHK